MTDALNRHTEALNRNTEAIAALTAVWGKLYARAKQLDKKESGTLCAAGVPITEIGPPIATVSPTRITEPAPNPAVAPTTDFRL